MRRNDLVCGVKNLQRLLLRLGVDAQATGERGRPAVRIPMPMGNDPRRCQRMMARRAGAKTVDQAGSHGIYVSQPAAATKDQRRSGKSR
jgi:hypothetical protein